MTIREKFKRRVIELIHGLPYEEAIKKEKFKARWRGINSWDIEDEYVNYPITIGRAMQALMTIIGYRIGMWDNQIQVWEEIDEYAESPIIMIDWKLTKENGQEADDDDQTDKTIETLYNLIK